MPGTDWLIEGLRQYVDAPDVDRLLARVNASSVSDSVLLYDVVGTSLLEAPFLQSTLEFMKSIERHGFSAATHRQT